MKLFKALIVATALSFGMGSSGHGAEPSATDSSKTAVQELLIKGDVQLIEGEFYFVKDTSGHEVRLHVNKETKMEDRIKVGDKIEARVTSEGHAMTMAVQIPKNGTAPLLSNTGPTAP